MAERLKRAMVRGFVSIIAVSALALTLPARAQNAPSEETLRTTIERIIAESRAAKTAETELVSRLDQEKVDEKAFAETVGRVEKNVKAIKSLIDTLDARYDQLSEKQKDTVREAWTVAELFATFVDNQKEGLSKLGDKDSRQEVRANAQCAVRRAAMLDEVLSRLTQK